MITRYLALSIAGIIAVPSVAQDAAAPSAAPPAMADAAPAMPMCSARVQDACQQTPRQEARAMSADQAAARDRGGEWTPNARGLGSGMTRQDKPGA